MRTWLLSIAAAKIRLFPLIVAGCVLAFPAYKGMVVGYVPVFAGLAIAVALLLGKDAASRAAAPDHRYVWSILLYAAPALVQFGLLLVFRPAPLFDGLFVYRHAEVLAATGAMDPMTYYPPAQTWWYASWFAAFGVSPLVAQLSQIPLSLGVTWTVYQLTRNLADERSARLAALATAWYPSFVVYVLTTPYYHYLYTLLTVVMTWGVMRFHQSDRFGVGLGWMLVAGLAAGAGALTKAVQLIAPLQVLTWWFVLGLRTSPPWRKWASGFAVFAFGMAAWLGPWMLRNHQVFDDWVPVCTSGGLVLYSANNPDSNGLYSAMPDEVVLSTPAEMLAHTRWCSDQAKRFMVEQPLAFLDLAWRKFLHTWGVEATFTELINWRGEGRGWIKPAFSAVAATGWAAMVALWAWSAWRRRAARASLTVFEIWAGVLILSNALVYVIFEGGDRHHLPLVPLMVVLLAERWTTDRRAVPDV